MTSWTAAVPYFPESEIACRCCGEIRLDIRLAVMLPALRQSWGKPLSPTSVCRCPKHNMRVKGHPTSFHLTTNPKWDTGGAGAADISWRDWPALVKLQFARMAHDHGFRIGLHDLFCHIDIGRDMGLPAKPFVYGVWAKPFSEEDVL